MQGESSWREFGSRGQKWFAVPIGGLSTLASVRRDRSQFHSRSRRMQGPRLRTPGATEPRSICEYRVAGPRSRVRCCATRLSDRQGPTGSSRGTLGPPGKALETIYKFARLDPSLYSAHIGQYKSYRSIFERLLVARIVRSQAIETHEEQTHWDNAGAIFPACSSGSAVCRQSCFGIFSEDIVACTALLDCRWGIACMPSNRHCLLPFDHGGPGCPLDVRVDPPAWA